MIAVLIETCLALSDIAWSDELPMYSSCIQVLLLVPCLKTISPEEMDCSMYTYFAVYLTSGARQLHLKSYIDCGLSMTLATSTLND